MSGAAARVRDQAERKAHGQEARERAPRRALGAWDPSRRARPAVAVLRSQEDLRDAELLPVRYGRMAESPWAYLRGAAAVMASDLASSPHTGLEVQLSGDAHVLNFGLWATPERNLAFSVRDFDEAREGPFEWDVKRLVASLVVLGRENAVATRTATAAVRSAARGYGTAMARYAQMSELDVWYDRFDADHLVQFLDPDDKEDVAARIAKRAARRTSEGAFDRLTEVVDGRRVITDEPGRRYHFDHAGQHELVQRVYEGYRSTLPYHVSRLLDRFTITDVARQVVGVGSVGMRVYLVLLEGESGRAPLFLQMKQAGPSVYEDYLGPAPYPSHGARVVAGQRMMQTAPDMFIGWTSAGGWEFYVRQFRDMKVNPRAASLKGYLVQFADACAHVLAKAHARSGDPLRISTYIGKGRAWQDGLVEFATAYADQTERDHAELVDAIANSEVEAQV
ncbi:MAG: DUF2252 domain-containing protein [Nocardiopsaceae bacterium]|nr:DUF2252 domain-containing protein [Nocardiopsaceae bacterium]